MTLMEDLAEITEAAGKITLQYFRSESLAVEMKSDLSPVTIADRETEKWIREEIGRRFPGDQVIGEEFGEGPGTTGARRWIVDPIDGTKSFVHGVPLYGVMIGVEVDGEIVAGAVGTPALGELVVAELGRGCFLNGRPCKVSSVSDLSKALLLTTDVRSHAEKGKNESFERVHSRCRLLRTWGDCYGHLMVATGRAEVMLDPEMSPWDCAALMPILLEAGGTFTDYAGKQTVYGADAFSTNSLLYEEVLALLQ